MSDKAKENEIIRNDDNQDIYVEDYYIRCKALNKSYTHIHMNTDVIITYKALALKSIKIELWMLDRENEKLLTDIRCILTGRNQSKITLETEITDIEVWSVEMPSCYTFRISIKDENDKEICDKTFEYGFRFIDISGSKIHINGREITLNGVIYNNYKEGKIEEVQNTYMEDIKIFKRNNINAVITYDYNSAPVFYDMCNKYGLYVITKPMRQVDNEEEVNWEEEIKKIIYKYKNEPCIIMWALDKRLNVSIESYRNIAVFDQSRPLYYGGDQLELKKYNPIELTYNFADADKAHMAHIHNEDDFAGKFLSHYIMEDCENEDVICKGIIFPNREMTPYAYEIKKEYAFIDVRPKDIIKGIFSIKNKGDYSNLKKYRFTWEVLEDGIVIKTGQLPDMDIALHEEQDIHIDYHLEKILENAWYHININMVTKDDTWWAHKDYTLAWSQYRIPYKVPKKRKIESNKENHIRNRKLKVEVFGDNFEIVIDKLKGNIRSIEFDRREYLMSPIKIYIENQTGLSIPSKVKDIIVDDMEGSTQIDVIRKCAGIKGNITTRYLIEPDGKITIFNMIRSSNKSIKVGMLIDIPSEFSDFSWFGKGPHDTYANRNTGTKVGLYYYNLYKNHIKSGNKSDVKWGAFTDGDGEGLLIESCRDILLNMHPQLYAQNLEAMNDGEYQVTDQPININVKCNNKAEYNIFDASVKGEDSFAFSIKRVI